MVMNVRKAAVDPDTCEHEHEHAHESIRSTYTISTHSDHIPSTDARLFTNLYLAVAEQGQKASWEHR